MSEPMATVHCTCFQDGRTRPSPLPREQLTVDRYGVVTVGGSVDHRDDPEELRCWRVGMEAEAGDYRDAPRACSHERMRVIDEIFTWPKGSHPARPERLIAVLDARGLTPLRALLRRHAELDGVWIEAHEAPGLLREIVETRPLLPRDLDALDARFLDVLTRLLEASAATGNPVITYYSGADQW